MLTYKQSTGIVTQNGTKIAKGWAGHDEGRNNPALQNVKCLGPLPRGLYTIDPWEDEHPHLGPTVAHLTPDPDNEEEGRSGFYIHGPSMDPLKFGHESMGCIVLPHSDRLVVKDSGETRLEVVW